MKGLIRVDLAAEAADQALETMYYEFVKGRKVSNKPEYIRSRIIEETANLEIRNSRFEKYAAVSTLMRNPARQIDAEAIFDLDSAKAKKAATELQFKLLLQHSPSSKRERFKAEYMKLGESRARFSNFILTYEQSAENIHIWRNELGLYTRAWQDFFHFAFDGLDKEHLFMAVKEYTWEVVKHLDKYFDSEMLDIAVMLQKIGVRTSIASQNQSIFITPVLSALGDTDILTNHLGEQTKEKVFYPSSDQHLINIMTAAHKQAAVRRMRSRSVQRINVESDDLYRADFFVKEETDAFRDNLDDGRTSYDMPFFGTSYTDSTGEISGDVLHAAKGMFKPSGLKDVFLFQEEEATPFSKSGKLGPAAEKMLSHENMRMHTVTNGAQIRNYIGNTTVHFVQTVGAMGLDAYINALRSKQNLDELTFVDEENIDGLIDELDKIRNKYKFVIQELNKRGVNVDERKVFENRLKHATKARAFLGRPSPNDMRARFLKGISDEAMRSVRSQAELFGDNKGTIEILERLKLEIRDLPASEKRKIFDA